jgi:serine-type D-Ala-D-Ala carboxypeptidase
MQATTLQISQEISNFLRKWIINPRVACLAVAGFAKRSGKDWVYSAGAGDLQVQRVFDLASLSKPFTALCAASLIERGKLNWDSTLGQLLPSVEGTFAAKKTIEELLSHRSGLMAHCELFRTAHEGLPIDRLKLLRWCADQKGNSAEGIPVYSDLGYILAGAALERQFGASLDCLIQQEVSGPWDIRVASARSFLAVHRRFAEEVAPTEVLRARGGTLRAMVHDDNAWTLSGWGCSGHAGLFGSVEALLRFGTQLLENRSGRLLAPLLRTRPGGTLLLGFDGKSTTNSSAGTLAGSRTFGHLGFTGTSFWCDPERERVTVLLTNRVYPSRINPRLGPLRSKIHDFLWGC